MHTVMGGVGRWVGGLGPRASFHTVKNVGSGSGAPAGPSFVERKACHARAESWSWRWVATGPRCRRSTACCLAHGTTERERDESVHRAGWVP